MEIVLASNNKHKVVELEYFINEMCREHGLESIKVLTLSDIGFTDEIIEDGKTFEENSYIKAYEAAKIMGIPALADDTGLCVDALDGRPGLYSARYAPTQKEKISKLLGELKNVPKEKRDAYFVCTMTLVSPSGEKIHTQVGKIDGYITNEPSGQHGFGYDPIFFIPELNKTMADMTLEEKNTLSHRARALKPMIEKIKTLY